MKKDETLKIDYTELGKMIGNLVAKKQEEYGDSFHRCGKILKILYPNGISSDQYIDALGIVRVIDKLFRIANGKKGNENPWMDISGYGLLGTINDEEIKYEGNL